MFADLEDFRTGWYGLSLTISEDEINNLIAALERLKRTKEHFHFRSNFTEENGVADIGIYIHSRSDLGTLQLEVDYRSAKT